MSSQKKSYLDALTASLLKKQAHRRPSLSITVPSAAADKQPQKKNEEVPLENLAVLVHRGVSTPPHALPEPPCSIPGCLEANRHKHSTAEHVCARCEQCGHGASECGDALAIAQRRESSKHHHALQTCRAPGCQTAETHLTSYHPCNRCFDRGHGADACPDNASSSGLLDEQHKYKQIDYLPKRFWCVNPNCDEPWNHTWKVCRLRPVYQRSRVAKLAGVFKAMRERRALRERLQKANEKLGLTCPCCRAKVSIGAENISESLSIDPCIACMEQPACITQECKHMVLCHVCIVKQAKVEADKLKKQQDSSADIGGIPILDVVVSPQMMSQIYALSQLYGLSSQPQSQLQSMSHMLAMADIFDILARGGAMHIPPSQNAAEPGVPLAQHNIWGDLPSGSPNSA
jgi:hypothetical protein